MTLARFWKRLLLATLATLSVFLALPSVAFAAGVGVDSDTAALLIVSPAWQLAISAAIPILVGLITKATLPTVWKGVLTLTLNAVATLVLTATMTDAKLITEQAFLQWAVAFGLSVAAYVGIYKPAELHSNPGGKLAPNVGLG